ncbi:hypothetical protein ACFL9T_21290, partial [Thermodesulfobacteriota bacterium]
MKKIIVKSRWLLVSMAIMALLMVPQTSESKPAKKIKIGVVSPMKFPGGIFTWNGATLAVEAINKAG